MRQCSTRVDNEKTVVPPRSHIIDSHVVQKATAMNHSRIVLVALLGLALVQARTVIAQNNSLSINRVDWTGAAATELAWNAGDSGSGQGTNWSIGFQPDRDFQDYASISNGGIATIGTTIAADPADILLAEDAASTGGLIIQDGGGILVSGDDISGNGNGQLINGVGGAGTLTLHDAISGVSIEGYVQNPASTLSLDIGGTTFNPVIVSREVELDGTLEITGALASATGASTWTIFDGTSDSASVTGQFDQIVNDSSFALGQGQSFAVSTANNSVTLGLQQQLVLRVDPYAGTAELSNPAGSGVSVDLTGYVMAVSNGTVDTGQWTSFNDDGDANFFENSSSNQLAETNATGMATLASGVSKDFGSPLAIDANQSIGTNLLDSVSFQYSTPDNVVVDAIVVREGNRQNNLVLVVDPNDGSAVLQNQSSEDVDLTGYTIQSASGALLTSWSSLEGQAVTGWDVVSSSANALAELNPQNSSLLGEGDSLDLGNVWDMSVEDLVLDFSMGSDSAMSGAVFYGEAADISFSADFNNDSVVDGLDFLVWQRGGSPNPLSSFDLALWQAQYGTTVPLSANSSAVPEPGGLCLAVVLLMGLGLRRCGDAKQQL